MSSNVLPFRARPRRALTNRAALQFLREQAAVSGQEGWLDFTSYADLADTLRWEKTRAWKACQAWKKGNLAEVNFHEETGQVSIRVLPDRGRLERGKGRGNSTPLRGAGTGRKRAPSHGKKPASPVETAVEASMEMSMESVEKTPVNSSTYVTGENSVEGDNVAAFASKIPPSGAVADTSPETAAEALPKAPETTPPQPLRQPASHAVVHGSERVVWRYADGDGGGGYDRAPPMSFMDVLLLLVAISLAGVAAILSISGMRILFAGTPMIALSLGIALESAKLIATGWLGTRWHQLGWGHRLPLIGMVLGVACINAVSVYSQLVASHLAVAGAEQVAFEHMEAEASGRLDLAQSRVNDLNRRIAQIDATVEGAAQKGRSKAAMDAMRAQQRQRADLVTERDRAQRELADLKTSRSAGSAKHQATINEALPIQYVAEFLGIHRGGEEVIRWLIAGVVAVTDPFALLLASALGARRRRRAA